MRRKIDKAIILAAGVGKRLQPYYPALPKTLINIRKRTVLERMITQLESCRIKEIILVTGFCHEKLDQFIEKNLRNKFSDLSFKLIFNPDYANKNNIYSFWMAREEMKNGFVLINSDVLFHPKILSFCLRDEGRSVLVIDDFKLLEKEDMKVTMGRNDIIKDISKDIPPRIANGEYIGITKLYEETTKLVLLKTKELLNRGRYNVFYEEAFKLVAKEGSHFFGVSTRGLPWIEIDTIDDLKRAREIILPKIESEV